MGFLVLFLYFGLMSLHMWLFSLHRLLTFFLCTEHSNKPFTHITFLNLNSKSLRKVLLLSPPFYRWGNEIWEQLKQFDQGHTAVIGGAV